METTISRPFGMQGCSREGCQRKPYADGEHPRDADDCRPPAPPCGWKRGLEQEGKNVPCIPRLLHFVLQVTVIPSGRISKLGVFQEDHSGCSMWASLNEGFCVMPDVMS